MYGRTTTWDERHARLETIAVGGRAHLLLLGLAKNFSRFEHLAFNAFGETMKASSRRSVSIPAGRSTGFAKAIVLGEAAKLNTMHPVALMFALKADKWLKRELIHRRRCSLTVEKRPFSRTQRGNWLTQRIRSANLSRGSMVAGLTRKFRRKFTFAR